MKNKLIALLLLGQLSAGIASAQQKGPSYKISGTIKGADTGWIYLVTRDGDGERMDSTRLQKGRFRFTPTLATPMVYALRLPGVRNQASFFTSGKSMTIVASKDSMGSAIVTGSALNNYYKEFDKAWARISAKAGEYYRRSDEVNKAKPDSASRRSLEEQYAALNVFARAIQDSFIRHYANSPVGAYVVETRYVAYNEFDKADEMYNALGPVAKTSFYGKKVKTALDIAAKTAIGTSPSFAQTDTSGKVVKLSDFKGRYVLVDFWASWCGPCRKENPNVVSAYNKYHDKGFDIIGVSLDNKKAPWLKAIQQDGLNWTHVSDLNGWKNALAKDFGISIVPTSFLVDKDGKIIAKNLRGEALHKKLAELMN